MYQLPMEVYKRPEILGNFSFLEKDYNKSRKAACFVVMLGEEREVWPMAEVFVCVWWSIEMKVPGVFKKSFVVDAGKFQLYADVSGNGKVSWPSYTFISS
jgi:hypothetical protein